MAIEAEFDRAAKVTQRERERLSIAGMEISAEEAERTYREIMNRPGTTRKEWALLNVHQLAALYQQMVRGPAPSAGATRSSSARSRKRSMGSF
jgi:hypothetical protein